MQGEKTKISSPTNRQRHSPVPLGGNGRNKELRTQQNFEGNLRVFNWEQDHTYCRIPPKLSKHSGGLGITPYQGLDRVEIVSPDSCKDNSDNGKAKCRPFCVTPVTSTPTVHVVETGLLLYDSRCPTTKMDIYVPLCFSPIFANRESFKENPRGQSCCNSRYSNMAVATLVPLAPENEHKKSNLPAKNTILMNPQGSAHPLIEPGSLRLAAWLISSNE